MRHMILQNQMKKTNIIFIIVVVLILFVDIGYYFFHPKTLPKITLFINSTQFSVEIAQTNEEHLRKLREEENGCYYCGRVNCSCNDRAEDFSEGPYIDPEEEPLSPEMEYWFTPCSKCGKYPEFCPCDGKFED